MKKTAADVELAILGGGIHGSMLFASLPEKLRKRALVIDQWEHPLECFFRQCRVTGVSYLRSPGSHSIHRDFRHLLRFAKKNGFDQKTHFAGRYFSPSLEVFEAHSNSVLEECGIREKWLRANVAALSHKNDVWNISTTGIKSDKTAKSPAKNAAKNNEEAASPPRAKKSAASRDAASHAARAPSRKTISARRVIVAMGSGEGSVPPNLAHVLSDQENVLSSKFIDPPAGASVCIIGGGMSGVQCAVRLARKGCAVTLATPHPIKVTYFDSNPGYIGPKCQPKFLALDSYDERANVLKAERYPGTINPAVRAEYEAAQKELNLRERVVRVVDAKKTSAGGFEAAFSDGTQERFDAIVCATGLRYYKPRDEHSGHNGYLRTAPHQHILSALIQEHNLPFFGDGVPIVSKTLEWHNGLFVSGELAELEIGPATKNIIGAHLAYRRLSTVWDKW